MSTLLGFLGFRTAPSTGDGGMRRNSSELTSKGFTLVELLVVIAIISILATLLLLQLGVARAKARDAKRIADVNQVRSALELFFDDNGRYMNTNVMTTLKPTYLVNIPRDPLAAGCTDTYAGTVVGVLNCYGYAYTNTAAAPSQMQVWAELEQRNANAIANDTDINSTGWSGAPVNGTTETCTTAVASDCIYDSGQP
ncbi:MAG: prepilin-type N-terminal cleavage/methylation domain-containing protein [Patescibacteria group bacterium]